MNKILCLLGFSFLIQMVNGQEVPNLLQSGESPAFGYMECYPNLSDKKLRHCNKNEFIFTIKSDTLHITEVHSNQVDVPKKTTVRKTFYSIAVKDLELVQAQQEIVYKNAVSRVMNMEGELQHFFKFKIYSNALSSIAKARSDIAEAATVRELTLYCENITDAKAFIAYLAELQKGE
jgi:hypothetical protein